MKTLTKIFLMASILAWYNSSPIMAQSISGNLNAAITNESLSYGNVDIYKGTKLVASVLTDRSGNFNVKLDTGTYRCEIQYAGYEKVVKQITVKNDEKIAVNMDVDRDSKYKSPPKISAPTVLSDGIDASDERRSSVESFTVTKSDYSTSDKDRSVGKKLYAGYAGSRTAYESETSRSPKTGGQAKSGVLTAGEINDFSKWTLWKDIVSSELNVLANQWKMTPKGRFVVQLVSATGLPIADAKVALLTKSSVVLFESRTDNTGKSELWVDLALDSAILNEKFSIEVAYQGIKKTIRNAKPFENGMNILQLETDCQQTNTVEIAFVVDATGSMGDEINFLKAELNEVMYQSQEISTALNFRFASVFYRDHGDAYLTRTMNFSRVLSESISFISEQSASGGGDYEEAVEIGLDSAINKLSWSESARARILFLVLDAPPHNTLEIRISLQKSMRSAAQKGIRIVPLVASGINRSTEYLMRCMALATNGTYVFLTDHSGVGDTHIKPITNKFDVELLSELMVRVIKSYTYMPECNQQVPELDLPYADSVVVYPFQRQPLTSDSVATKSDSIQPISLQISWKFFPNPTKDFITVITDRDVEALYLTDLTGKALQILHNIQKESPIRIDLSEYPSGIYLLRYPIDKSWVTGKVVLAR